MFLHSEFTNGRWLCSTFKLCIRINDLPRNRHIHFNSHPTGQKYLHDTTPTTVRTRNMREYGYSGATVYIIWNVRDILYRGISTCLLQMIAKHMLHKFFSHLKHKSSESKYSLSAKACYLFILNFIHLLFFKFNSS